MKWMLLPRGSYVYIKRAELRVDVIAMKVEDNPEVKVSFIDIEGNLYQPVSAHRIILGE